MRHQIQGFTGSGVDKLPVVNDFEIVYPNSSPIQNTAPAQDNMASSAADAERTVMFVEADELAAEHFATSIVVKCSVEELKERVRFTPTTTAHADFQFFGKSAFVKEKVVLHRHKDGGLATIGLNNPNAGAVHRDRVIRGFLDDLIPHIGGKQIIHKVNVTPFKVKRDSPFFDRSETGNGFGKNKGAKAAERKVNDDKPGGKKSASSKQDKPDETVVNKSDKSTKNEEEEDGPKIAATEAERMDNILSKMEELFSKLKL